MTGTIADLVFETRDRVQIAIDRLRQFVLPDGAPYWLGYSGGKDSEVCLDLAKRSGAPFVAHYNRTGIDPPEVLQHIRQHHPEVVWERPAESMWRLIERNGLPTRTRRWCCEELKERGGEGTTVVTGVRWEESNNRKARRLYEVCRKDGMRHYLNPIIDWTTAEVWHYIRSHDLPYCRLYDEGFTRIGCILCPMTDPKPHMERWPKIAEAWRRAAYRYWDRQTPGGRKFKTPERFWQWWLSRKRAPDEAQCRMFE